MNINKATTSSSSWGPLTSAKKLVIDALKIPESTHHNNENIFHFLEQQATQNTHLILLGALTQYSTEANYRFAIASLIEGPPTGTIAAIAEEITNPRVPLIFRAARTLGIDGFIKTTVIDNYIIVHFNRGLNKQQIEAWRLDPAPFLQRPEEEDVVKKTINAIKNRTPLSLVRIGHCEVRFLGQEIFYGPSDLTKSCQIQWGDIPPSDFLNKVRNDIKNSISNAHIVGFKKRNTLKSRSLNILDNSVLTCLSTLNLLKSNQIQCSPNIHFTLGEDKEFIEALKEAKRITIVTSRSVLAEKLRRICKPETQIKLHKVPGEARIDGASDIRARASRFVEIENILKSEVTTGEVVLIGAGVAGKIYCEIARTKGAIGIDLGSTLDAWSGIDTRGNGFPENLKNALN